VTESGKLYVAGNAMRTHMGVELKDDKHFPFLVELPDDMTCLRAWCVSADHDPENNFAVYAEMKDKKDVKSLWSIGKKLLGLDKEETTKFMKVPLPDDAEVDVLTSPRGDISLRTTKGELFQWSYKGEKWADGAVKPKPMDFVNRLGKVLEYRQSKSHILALVETKKGEKKLYAVGQEYEGSHQHLGKKDKKDLKDGDRVHLLADFENQDILDFAAGYQSTLVLLAGPGKSANDGLYQHELADGTKSQGLIHFYKKDDKWVFLPAE
jgi:hypothetical protein